MKASVFIGWLLYTFVESWGYIWGKCGILWTQKQQDALVEKYNADPDKYADYRQGALYGGKWIGHRVADCANLLRWAAKQSGDDGVHSGSNLIWDCDLSAKGALKNGKRTDGGELKPGTFVFTGETESKHPHVGCYIGNGEVIEDYGTTKGVIKSKITDSKWKWWGERKGMDFDVPEGTVVLPAEDTEKPVETAPSTPAEPADDKTVLPTLKRGSKGEKVRELQEKLMALGYALPKYGADGDFGAETEKAVKQFQKDWGLKQDGVVGSATWERLLTVPEKPKLYTVTITHLSAEKADEIVNKYGGTKAVEG